MTSPMDGEARPRPTRHALPPIDRCRRPASSKGPGAYAHIPSGVDHDIDATTTDGCTVFYLYLRVAS